MHETNCLGAMLSCVLVEKIKIYDCEYCKITRFLDIDVK